MGKLQKQDFKTETDLVNAGATAADLLNDTQIYVTANTINKTLDDAITDGDIGGGGSTTELIIKDVKSSGTNGQLISSGSYQTRTLNTSSGDTSFLVSLSSSQFVLDAGDYFIDASVPGYQINNHKAKLRNVTAGSDLIIGQSASSNSGDMTSSVSRIVGEFTVAASQSLEIQHRCTQSSGRGGGQSSGFGDDEVYTQVVIKKIG